VRTARPSRPIRPVDAEAASVSAVVAAGEIHVIGSTVAMVGSTMVKVRATATPVAIRPRSQELAARGEYREAIHTLLLRTLQELVRSSAVRVGPAMTSREILGRVPIAPDARDALQGLIVAVELTHFGDDEATEEEYRRCLAQFQKFATAFRASAPRGTGTGTALGAIA